MDGGKLHVVAVQRHLDHRLVQTGGVLSSRVRVEAFGLGSHRHQQRSGAAGEVGDVQRTGELVVAPVHALRPVVKHETRQQRGCRHRGVVGAGELGVRQQRMEQAARQIVTFEPPRVLHRLDEMLYRRPLHVVRSVAKDMQYVCRQLEDRNVVDVVADVLPCLG